MRKNSLPLALLTLAISLNACETEEDVISVDTLKQEVNAWCDGIQVGNYTNKIDIENDYLPHVVCCENGNASDAALRSQAVAARSYLYYKLLRDGSIGDSQSDQVYTCNRAPSARHYQAVADTAGQILTYNNTVVAAFYVSGAIPQVSNMCIPTSTDTDPHGNEHYVTYNEGLSGNNITQTSLGWRNERNYANRGCQSQNGANCLGNLGYNYEDILRFYYGEDIVIEQVQGACIAPLPDAGELDASTPHDASLDSGAVDSGAVDSGASFDSGAAGYDASLDLDSSFELDASHANIPDASNGVVDASHGNDSGSSSTPHDAGHNEPPNQDSGTNSNSGSNSTPYNGNSSVDMGSGRGSVKCSTTPGEKASSLPAILLAILFGANRVRRRLQRN